ncbi:MAG: hypothetical protein LBQ40_07545 [Clostridiales bacterium]|nr:hypothetical protein [Clostridiales bacterium]
MPSLLQKVQPKNINVASDDTVNYYNKRIGDDGLQSLEIRIAHAKEQAEEYTEKYLSANGELLRKGIETKMKEIEILLNDLETQKAELELERGLELKKEHIVAFLTNISHFDPKDITVQQDIIENLVAKVFIMKDGEIVVARKLW